MERVLLNNAQPGTPGTLQLALSNGHCGGAVCGNTRESCVVRLQSSPWLCFLVLSNPTCHLAARRMPQPACSPGKVSLTPQRKSPSSMIAHAYHKTLDKCQRGLRGGDLEDI
ncbi:hypothetical protein JOQ06_023236 [Pogonophryne albipinna]|uniref:Uncharacterized protein n=1 Tax=Pogonophryne albipinna TaxID=1090488 RepID=A0AAD6BNW3_9TELE|nr:hypothetical protein JOQ06_023236 [Pogonophryne albipinna]